jgi:putative ABC transport system permease protein
MKISKCLKHAFDMVIHSQVRSWLTILGIVIGVASVIAIMSLSTGMQETMNSQLNLGGDLITLTAGYSRGASMFGGGGPPGEFGGGGASATTETIVVDKSDVQVLKSIPEIEMIGPQISGSVNASYLSKSGKVTVNGVDQKVWAKITTTTIADGRMLDSADQNVVVIGGRLASSYFGQPLGINKMITLNGNSFRVVGVLDDQSNSVYMPLQMAYQIIPDKTYGVYDSIVVKIKDENQLDTALAKITSKMMIARHVTNKTQDFSVSSNKQMQETRSSVMSSMQSFLLAIAAVSLIVGAVGVANTMFTSVLEKTKEIGIMKAIGARNKDILLIFLFNAALIGLVGGILGTIFGTILSALLPALMGTSMLTRSGTIVSLDSVLLALGVSVFVGIAAGIIPARQGSKLKPVDALRYE